MGLDYKIQYKKRVENRVVDALSRRGESAEIMTIITVKPNWVMKGESKEPFVV